jgi:imidazoleglycerol-phosphate dehydratase/histidinol-phosphatase
MSATQRIAFVDRDGTMIKEPADQQVDSLAKIELVPGAIPAMLRLKDAGYRFVMVSNQDGRGTDSFPEDDFRVPQDFTVELFA